MKTKSKVIWLFLMLFIGGLSCYYFYPEKKLPAEIQIDKLLVYKSQKKLFAYSKGELIKTYSIALGRQEVGGKVFKGDEKTPEGLYFIVDKNPSSGYHKNTGISYPNKKDIEAAKKLGELSGGDVKIHGIRNKMGFIGKFHRWFNWTLGCIAVTNEEMDELYHAVKIGSPTTILP